MQVTGHRFKTIMYAAVGSMLAATAVASASELKNPNPAPILDGVCLPTTTFSCVASNFEKFLGAARNNDAHAVDVLYKSLLGCNSPDTLSASGPVTVTNMSTGKSHTSPNDDRLDRVLATVRARCANFDAAQISAFDEINWLAAAQGNIQALFNLTSLISHNPDAIQKAGQKDKLFTILQKNIASKRFDSFTVLSQIYSEGLLTKRDYVKAYAYSLAYLSTLPDTEKSRHALQSQRLSSRLSVAEKAEAEDSVRTLLAY